MRQQLTPLNSWVVFLTDMELTVHQTLLALIFHRHASKRGKTKLLALARVIDPQGPQVSGK